MNDSGEKVPKPKPIPSFSGKVGSQARRKLRARTRGTRGVWFGLGMMGLIGWSVVVPTLLGAGLGWWLDTHYRSNHSWALALLVAGLAIGCLNAWHWVSKEEEAMRAEQDQDDVL
jgi:ATP synthase protein I